MLIIQLIGGSVKKETFDFLTPHLLFRLKDDEKKITPGKDQNEKRLRVSGPI